MASTLLSRDYLARCILLDLLLALLCHTACKYAIYLIVYTVIHYHLDGFKEYHVLNGQVKIKFSDDGDSRGVSDTICLPGPCFFLFPVPTHHVIWPPTPSSIISSTSRPLVVCSLFFNIAWCIYPYFCHQTPSLASVTTMADLDAKPLGAAVAASSEDPAVPQEFDPESGVRRGLKTRHLSMMALAGIIGPGLLVGSGGALSSGGPASLLIGFGVIGLIAFSIMQSLGEVTTLYPSGGAFTKLADRFVDKAFGVAVGWNYFIIWAAVLANEYNTVSAIFVFWSDKVPLWGYFLIFWFAFLGFQLLGVEAFGEAEFWLAYNAPYPLL